MIIISHDRHFLNSVCTHMADLDYGTLRVYPGNYDDYMIASTQARERLLAPTPRPRTGSPSCEEFVRRFSANKSQGPAGDLARQADREDQARGREAVVAGRTRTSGSSSTRSRSCIATRWRSQRLAKGWPGQPRPLFADLTFLLEAGERLAIVGPNGTGKTTLLRTLIGELAPDARHGQVGGEGAASAITRRTRRPISRRT